MLKNKPKIMLSVLATTLLGAGGIITSGMINSRSLAPRTSVATFTQIPTPSPTPTAKSLPTMH